MDALVFKDHSRIPNDIAELPGTRAVYTSEVQQNSRLNEALVKDITGGDTISARFMRSNWFRFTPQFKLWMYGNHRPVIIGMDEGIWRRIKLIPFKVQISDQEKDGNLQEKLIKELPGILSWVVEGCLLWQKHGLEIPSEVIEATSNYRNEMDTIEMFLQERCVFKPFAKSTAKALYEAYSDWCRGNGENPLSQKRLGERLSRKGFEKRRFTNGPFTWGVFI
jgi:putative DNA primase/helicase